MQNKSNKQGSALIVSLLILMLIITIALSVTLASIQNQTASNGEYKSSRSLQMADAGIEDFMYQLTKAGYATVDQIPGCQASGWIKNANYMIRLQDVNNVPINCSSTTATSLVVSIKSVSNQSGQSRAVEADVICRSPFKRDANTVALYNFQEQGNSILDASNLNNIGAVNGNVPTVTGICSARSFNGNAANYISVPDNNPDPNFSKLKITGPMTVEAWVKWDGTSVDWQRIVGKGDVVKRNYGLWMGPNGPRGWLFQIYDGIGGICNAQDISAGDTPDTHWHFLVGTYDGSHINLYLDGNRVINNLSCAITPATSDDPLTIGYAVGFGAGHSPFSGVIDEVSVSTGAKSAGTIAAEYTQGSLFHLP